MPLGARAYDIRIGPGLLARAGAEIAPLLRRPRVAILTEARVAALHLPALRAGLAEAGIAAAVLELPPGEATKGWAALERAVEWLIAEKVGRDDLVVAFGGGVIGDLAGFAAAILRRGVGFVQVPTTLLAQVDSSVGGKTGINSAPGQEPDRRLPPAAAGAGRHRPARHAAGAGLPRRLRRGGEVRAARRRRLLPLAGGERAGARATATRRRGSTRCGAPAR